MIFPELSNLSLRGKHGYANSYEDKEILCVHNVLKVKQIDILSIYYTKNKKPIIQQQATCGCTAAATAMLIYEYGKPITIKGLRRRNMGTTSTKINDIKNAGLNPLKFTCKNLTELEFCLRVHGSAIVSIDNGSGGHAVVVDEILDDRVRIRDPYHGWEVDITKEAFLSTWEPLIPIIQIKG